MEVFGMKKRALTVVTILSLVLSLSLMPTVGEARAVLYKVQPGDTMWEIATRNGISLSDILSANPHLTDPNRIYPYQLIIVPKNAKPGSYKPGSSQPGNTQSGSPSGQPSASPAPSAPTQQTSISEWEQQVVDLVNAERAKAGLRPLEVDAKLTQAARAKSADMRDRNYFSHQSPTYGSPFEMMDAFSISYRTAGENIAAGQRSPQAVMDAWMNSPGHRQNILNPNYTRIGVGLVQGGSYGYYWTQLFAG